MSAGLSAFHPIEGIGGIYTARKGNLRCTAISLQSGGLCLFSPVEGLTEQARESLAKLGEVKWLLAPNHYHNKGLRAYVDAYPEARLCCSVESQARLVKLTGLNFDSLDDLRTDLPATMRIVETSGLKTGEVWIASSQADGLAWIVVDAFCGPKADTEANELQILGTFPKFGVADPKIYTNWLNGEIQRRTPSLVVPCHGALVRGANLAGQMIDLTKALL